MMIISFFLILSIKQINEASNQAIIDAKHSTTINELINNTYSDPGIDGYKIIQGEGNIINCIPKLINNHAGRVCIAT